jgi:hypothetical protein
MTRRIISVLLVIVTGLLGASRDNEDVQWSAHVTKTVFKIGEPISIAYEFANTSDSKVLVPKLVNPFASVRLRFRGPDRHEMRWNGAQFTFKYKPSDFICLGPGQRIAGQFEVPTACPDEPQITKGGYCFTRKGTYVGKAEFLLGLNAFYDREKLRGPLAEGRYTSRPFTFRVH